MPEPTEEELSEQTRQAVRLTFEQLSLMAAEVAKAYDNPFELEANVEVLRMFVNDIGPLIELLIPVITAEYLDVPLYSEMTPEQKVHTADFYERVSNRVEEIITFWNDFAQTQGEQYGIRTMTTMQAFVDGQIRRDHRDN